MDRYKDMESMVNEFAPSGWDCPQPRIWIVFFEWLKTHGNERDKPKMSLVLAAWSCSSWQKRERLIEQLMWAEDHGVLEAALDKLKVCPIERWDTGEYGDDDIILLHPRQPSYRLTTLRLGFSSPQLKLIQFLRAYRL